MLVISVLSCFPGFPTLKAPTVVGGTGRWIDHKSTPAPPGEMGPWGQTGIRWEVGLISGGTPPPYKLVLAAPAWWTRLCPEPKPGGCCLAGLPWPPYLSYTPRYTPKRMRSETGPLVLHEDSIAYCLVDSSHHIALKSMDRKTG